MNNVTTTDQLEATVKDTLHPYGMVHVDQVLEWLHKQADITRAECMAEEVSHGRSIVEVGPMA